MCNAFIKYLPRVDCDLNHLLGKELLNSTYSCELLYLYNVGHRVMVAHDLQADDEKVQKKVAKKLARQQVWIQ